LVFNNIFNIHVSNIYYNNKKNFSSIYAKDWWNF